MARRRAIVEFTTLDFDSLINVSLVHEFLNKLCEALDMGVLFPPLVTKGPYTDKSDQGITGFMFWQFSGCQVHTFVRDGVGCIDLFSCKDFSIEKIFVLIEEFFHVEKIRFIGPDKIEEVFSQQE